MLLLVEVLLSTADLFACSCIPLNCDTKHAHELWKLICCKVWRMKWLSNQDALGKYMNYFASVSLIHNIIQVNWKGYRILSNLSKTQTTIKYERGGD